jgi:glutaminyl-peptide cyclotransferase
MKPFSYAILAVVVIIGLTTLLTYCNNPPPSDDKLPEGPKSISFSVTHTYPHDTSFFTEGLLFYKGELYESTGEKEKSKLLKMDLKTGKPIMSVDLADENFGEGIVIVNDTVYQLTYQEKVGFMYSVKDFKRIGKFEFSSPEGWGMTTNGKEIIASDGTSNLFFYQPGTFRLLRTLPVMEAGGLSFNINELEYIDGFIYANQWQLPYILKIDPVSGVVVGKADLSTITTNIRNKYPYADVMNGIAYNDSTKKTYITGKKWPELYEIEFSK